MRRIPALALFLCGVFGRRTIQISFGSAFGIPKEGFSFGNKKDKKQENAFCLYLLGSPFARIFWGIPAFS
jgi:hypothetical protein